LILVAFKSNTYSLNPYEIERKCGLKEKQQKYFFDDLFTPEMMNNYKNWKRLICFSLVIQ